MKKLLTVCLLAILYVTSAFAQSGVTVTVKDDVGAVPGASVLIKGTTIGDLTDIDGVVKFDSVKDTDVLVVSFIGYRTVEVTVGTRAKIEVVLEVDSEQLEETVVVGYGQQKKSSLTSAISTVKSEDIVSTKQTNLVASLQGKVPGLQIRQKSGKPGTFDTDLSLRGFGSPLVIIDGVARTAQARNGDWGYWMDENGSAALAQLNPEDIESITVLKDASAAIYGLEASNGVILVTTKKGQIGKPTVNYSNNFSFGVPTSRPDQVDIVTYMQLENEMRINSKQGAKFSDEYIQHYINGEDGYVDTDWYDVVMKDYAFNMTHNVSVRGGNQQTQYYLSGNYTEDNSILTMDNMNNDRLSFNGNVTSKITNELTAMFQTSIMYSKLEGMAGVTNQNIWYYTTNADRTIPAHVLTNPDHYSALPDSENRNPLAITDRDAVGYSDNRNLTFRNNLEVKYEPKWKLIGSHTARRTFSTNNVLRGLKTSEIRRATGHKSESSFEKYICYFDE
jgi:TonB-linked SusC/RagA family outer membrane protein